MECSDRPHSLLCQDNEAPQGYASDYFNNIKGVFILFGLHRKPRLSVWGFCKVTLRFVFQGLQNAGAGASKCQVSIKDKWMKYWCFPVSSPCAQYTVRRWGEEGWQLQRNIQLRVSTFGAKMWNERFNVIAEGVSRGDLSGERGVPPPSRWLFHDSAILFSRHLFEQKRCYFNQQMRLNWLRAPLTQTAHSPTSLSIFNFSLSSS